jgi:hypothetical protein
MASHSLCVRLLVGSRRLMFGLLLAVLLALPATSWAAFEIEPGSFSVSTSSDRAGAHADLTTSFSFVRSESGPPKSRTEPGAVGGQFRGAEVILPVGFAGYPANVKTCDSVQLNVQNCPADSQVGTLAVVAKPLGGPEEFRLKGAVYNMKPAPNITATFGFNFSHVVSGLITFRLGPDYRVHARATDIVTAELLRETLTVWGVPADASHDAQRAQQCFGDIETEFCQGGGVAVAENAVPFLVNPTQCTTKPLTADLTGVESWEGDRAPEGEATRANVGPFTGCSSLRFAPTIAVAPEVTQAVTPSGYEVQLKVPQSEGAESLATADLKDAVVRMPKGVVLSPSAANGLETCGEAQVGLHSEQPVGCPDGSKLGTVSVMTPALTGELKGGLYLGGPASGPITGPPFTVYLTFEGHGVLVKIRGTATPDPVTGQVTTTFDENPELPFSELKLHLTGGSRATLANPSACGSYHADADFTPWSTPFTADALTSSAPFEITGCGGPRFAPSFAAGTTSNQAGGYSPMRVTFSRQDTDQQLGGLTVTMPPGVSGDLSKVPLCGEPQAREGTCSEASRIGEVTAAAGPGPEPVYTTAGKVFLTGPYGGAPFGLTIDASEHAGPFDLGSGACDCEVVRAAVAVDPHTAQLTVVSGALPTMKDGIPLQVKLVNVDVNRPEFVFNPTSCDPMSIGGSLSSTQGASTGASSHFQVTNCAALAFEPGFKVATSGKTSKQNGASLDVKLAFPNTPQGSEANIRKVKVELPKQLPSRLTTLQQACLARVFEANPASCPAASVVGYAKAITPILPVPLTGPAYFVSHGGEAFPSLEIVLQGYGVTVELVGSTFISKSGVTSSTFATVPDVPVGTFELYLPQGRFSALAANTGLCRVKGGLHMPTEFVSQDNRVLHQSTPVRVTGCPKARAARRAHKARRATRAGRNEGRSVR